VGKFKVVLLEKLLKFGYYIDAERRDAPLIPVLSALKEGDQKPISKFLLTPLRFFVTIGQSIFEN